ncbi:MAG: ATP-binding protein [Faecalibacterium prausnitzii]|nr:ATP-binding protein [Faecalibacterium prausnitzii]
MALKKFARRDVILPAVVFLLTFVVALFSLRLLSLNQEKDERLRAVYAAESTISRVSSQLNRYLAESDFIKKYIESGHVLREEEFAVISSNMQDGSSVIKTHELAKDGVVSQVYPVAGNEAAIGLDMLHNPARKKEANLAKNSGMYTIAGPFELVQGGTGALLFDPIYTYSEKGERSFWGFSILVLQWDDFIEEVELDKMEDAGYRYQIWKKDPYTGEKIVIAESEEDFPGNALEVACSVPNDTWYFEIIPKAGWFSDQQLSLGIAIATIIGIMAAYACWELMNRHQKDLQHEAALEKSAQKARAANEAKTRFLFNMSHDIRTPMNAIIGFSELLEKHIDEKDKVLDYTEKIRSSSAFLLSLINYVLEMARIESGKAVLKEETGDLCALMQTLSDVFEPSVQQKKLTCTYHTDVEHPYIVSDRTKVREILLNVISNAIKYTPEGGHIAVSVKELPAEKPKTGRYTFTVQDDGIGMSEEYLPHIFEEFTREHTSTESKVIGTGLGLPIVKALVEWMNGSIDVQSKLGAGTTVTITLGFPLADEAQKSVEEQDAEGDAAQLKGCRILLAEDNDLNAEIVVTILEESGLTVERTADGELCIEALKAHPAGYYDAILMDIQMPNMDGYQAAKLIRNLSGNYRTIPIIAMTANAFDEDRQKALSVGMDAHLAKPVDVKRLFGTLRKVIR